MVAPHDAIPCRRCGTATRSWRHARERSGGPPVEIRHCPCCLNGMTVSPPAELPAARTQIPNSGIARRIADHILHAELRPLLDRLPEWARVVDIGAGSGNRSLILARAGHDVTAVEPDGAEAARARGQLGGRAAVHHTTIEALDDTETGFDAALLSHVLEHLDDPDQGLRAIRARMRPGGLLVAMVPNAGGIEAKVFRNRWHGWEPARHRWHFTRAGLARLLSDGGYREVSVRAHGGWRYPATLAFSLAPGLDPQLVSGARAVAGRALAIGLAPVAALETAARVGPQLVAVATA